MTHDPIPYNKVSTNDSESAADIAEREGISEEEWRACNLPASKLEFRWRYSDKTIHLYERRLRSLAAFNVGPAVRAWVRSRMEWVRDNKLWERPNGLIVLTVDPEGVVDLQLEGLPKTPMVTPQMVESGDYSGTLWTSRDGKLICAEEPRLAADTLVRDLGKTLGYEVMVGQPDLVGAEAFVVSDEFGIIGVEGHEGPVYEKLDECFEKLWTLKK